MDSVKNILPAVLKGLQNEDVSKRQKLTNQWPQIVGAKLEKHTRPRLGQSGQLVIWVDQSTLAFEIQQKYKQAILKRAQAVLGEQEISDVIIRVGQLR